MSKFDQLASGWDANPMHKARTAAIAMKMQEMIPLDKGMKAMEFGAGTGLLSLELRDKLATVTVIDSSQEMIRITSEKISELGIKNLFPLFSDLEKDSITDKFDLIFNQMVFHHVKDIEGILVKFRNSLAKGGYAAIADLYPEDGSFHGEGFDVHHGFDPSWLGERMKEAGFTDIRFEPCFMISKPDSTGNLREYPVFLLTGKV